MTVNRSGWADPSIYLEHIHVAEEVASLAYTQEILARANLPWSIVAAGETPSFEQEEYSEGLSRGKKHLFLCNNRGAFFKPCPGTSEYQCCGYHVLNIGLNCPIDCVYCILQAYLNQPWITAFVNIDALFDELDEVLNGSREKFFRIGTGEFTDSLALERITGLSAKLASYMSDKENGVLELKTKSCSIESLKDVDHQGRTILSWSLNSPTMMKTHEIRSANLEERLAAAALAADWGYGLAFHFDPIVYHEQWRSEYRQTIDLLFRRVPKEAIAWISIGALRYLPALKNISIDRFPHSRIFHQEFICGLDGKQRYFRALRERMYAHIYSLLQAEADEGTCIYFCMESDEIWQAATGFLPEEKGGIAAMLDAAARRIAQRY